MWSIEIATLCRKTVNQCATVEQASPIVLCFCPQIIKLCTSNVGLAKLVFCYIKQFVAIVATYHLFCMDFEKPDLAPLV